MSEIPFPWIFYTNPMSRGQIARWALHEAGVEYEQVLLDYGTTMKGEEYLAINPMGKVPAIKHGDRVVTESAAICAYLAETCPNAGLAPTEDERADYLRWMFFGAGPLEAAVTMKSLGWQPEDDQQRMVGYGSYDQTVDTLESHLAGGDYVCGDRFTMADVYVGSQVDWGITFGTMPKREVFEAYVGRLNSRKAYGEAKAIDGQLIAEQQAAESAEQPA